MTATQTYFAPAARADKETITRQNKTVSNYSTLHDLFSAIPDVAVILNQERQIIYANEALLSLLPDEQEDLLLGKRPGEAVSCIHSAENDGGCGTSESCRYCGAVNAVLESQKKNEKVTKECRIVSFVEDEEYSFDFEVTALPVMVKGENYTYVIMKDISNEKRRIALERIFFHDIINTAGGIQGFTSFLTELDDPVQIKDYIKTIDRLSHDLIDEIQAQRSLSQAENNELQIKPKEISADIILDNIKNTISYHAVAESKKIVIEKTEDNTKVVTDELLLKRVILNMLKNALEASKDNGVVKMGYTAGAGSVVFFVHNDQYMEKSVQHQVFKRSFSTKGKDRGLGTYSIKLLGEKYLKGEVWFETEEATGTDFFLEIPYFLKEENNNNNN